MVQSSENCCIERFDIANASNIIAPRFNITFPFDCKWSLKHQLMNAIKFEFKFQIKLNEARKKNMRLHRCCR